MAQTLGQFYSRVWRYSHPLIGTYRLAAQIASERQIWFKHLVNIPSGYVESPCCRAPLLPMLSREVNRSGLICFHCGGTAVPMEEIPQPWSGIIQQWAEEYAPVHQVAHDDNLRKLSETQEESQLDEAAKKGEALLIQAATHIAPGLLDYYPSVIWEDQDECLEIRPEDLLSR